MSYSRSDWGTGKGALFKKKSTENNIKSQAGTMRTGIRREEKESCCTWPRILLLVILLIVAGLLVWKLVPWDDTINDALNKVPIPGDNSGNYGTDEDSGIPNKLTTLYPTVSPTPASTQYQFMQCDPENTGQTDCCNGLEGICDLRVDEVMYATLHNGMATYEDGFVFGPNHKFKLEGALEAGYRGINLDICNCGGELIFCHGECLKSLFLLCMKFGILYKSVLYNGGG